ncbi:MAG TPA: hypothetical protein VFH18_03715 [Erysipelotrichaceae bacterium]|jgi:hypothetical protein|nr:hypothetical protein [Erysipelotrichaceae bacterium]
MNLRKVILSLALIFFSVLFYCILQAYAFLDTAVKASGVTLAELSGSGFNTFIVWLQFPLVILLIIIFIYLIFGDKSLTAQAQNAKPLK